MVISLVTGPDCLKTHGLDTTIMLSLDHLLEVFFSARIYLHTLDQILSPNTVSTCSGFDGSPSFPAPMAINHGPVTRAPVKPRGRCCKGPVAKDRQCLKIDKIDWEQFPRPCGILGLAERGSIRDDTQTRRRLVLP